MQPRVRPILVAAVGLFILSVVVDAQTPDGLPPFIGGPLTVFDVERQPMDSGQLMNAKRYVSAHDRKYVTYGGNNTSTSSLALQEVQDRQQVLQVGHWGYVGGILPAGKKPVSTTLPMKHPPKEIVSVGESVSIFDRRGVFLISPLK
jgi:hypothetical protein